MEYNYEELKALHDKDPEEFDKFTSILVNAYIDNTRSKNKDIYKAKQWRLEQELKKYSDPVQRLNKFIELFWIEFASITKPLLDRENKDKEKDNPKPACTVVNIKPK